MQSGLIHALYQLNALPFLQTLERAPKEHGRRTFCGTCYHLGHYEKDYPFHQCPHCLLTQPQHDEDQCLDNPKYSRPTTIKQESPSLPPLRINKRGWKQKKPKWKRFQENIDRSLVRGFEIMDQKSNQELKTFSTDTSYCEECNKEANDNINNKPSHFHDF